MLKIYYSVIQQGKKYKLSCHLIGSHLYTLTSYCVFVAHSKSANYINLPFTVDSECSSDLFAMQPTFFFGTSDKEILGHGTDVYLGICHLFIHRRHLFTSDACLSSDVISWKSFSCLAHDK